MELYPIDLAIHIVNIIVLYVLLRLLLFKPVCKFMKEREQRIQAQLDDAAAKQAAVEQEQKEYAEKLSSAEAACSQMVSDCHAKNNVLAQQMLAEARQDADRIRKEAQQEAAEAALRTMDAAKREMTELAVDMAGRVLRFDEQTRANVAKGNQAKSGLKRGQLKLARETSQEEIAAITDQLEKLLGCNLELTVQIDASLMGGYAAFVDGKVYDFSYAAQLSAMKQQLS